MTEKSTPVTQGHQSSDITCVCLLYEMFSLHLSISASISSLLIVYCMLQERIDPASRGMNLQVLANFLLLSPLMIAYFVFQYSTSYHTGVFDTSLFFCYQMPAWL